MNPQTNNLQSKKLNIVITGGNTGIGYAVIKNLYLQGHHIIFGARNELKNKQALQLIMKAGQQSQIDKNKLGVIAGYKLDLTQRDSVDKFAQNVYLELSKQDQDKQIGLDILINNAGLLGQDTLQLSQNNIQITLHANYFGHFYLTYLLLPLLHKSSLSKIINVGSDAYHKIKQVNQQQKLNPGEYPLQGVWDLSCSKKTYDSMQQYTVSKLFTVLFTVDLQNKLFESKHIIKTVSIHPGFVATTFGDHNQLVRNIKKQYANLMITTQKGAQSILKLCNMQFDELKAGQYYDQHGNTKQMSKISKDQKIRQKLWKISEDIYAIQKFM